MYKLIPTLLHKTEKLRESEQREGELGKQKLHMYLSVLQYTILLLFTLLVQNALF